MSRHGFGSSAFSGRCGVRLRCSGMIDVAEGWLNMRPLRMTGQWISARSARRGSLPRSTQPLRQDQTLGRWRELGNAWRCQFKNRQFHQCAERLAQWPKS